jgi:hypothetical protein
VRINSREYGCSSYSNGGHAACGNNFKLHAADAEALLLKQIETSVLSPEAVEAALTAYRLELKRLRREQAGRGNEREASNTASARKDRELEQLRQMIRAGSIDGATLQPVIEAAERERERLVQQWDAREDSAVTTVVRLAPQAAEQYRDVVRQLGSGRELLTDAEFTEARSLVFELMGGRVMVRPERDDSATLVGRPGPALILKAYKSAHYKVVAGAGFEPATFGL